jgi:two-component system, cell cycle response regulator
MVVDDVASNVILLEGRLVGAGFEVVMALSGEECLAMIANNLPDLVLLDVMMPGMDGTEVCRRIKSDPATAHVPVVMVTALNTDSALEAATQAGANDFLVKPMNDDTLFSCIRKFMHAV